MFVSSILANEEHAPVIQWLPSGESFVVLDPETLSRDVLPLFFHHRNWTSFTRQLHKYGFRRVSKLHHTAFPTSSRVVQLSLAYNSISRADLRML